MGLSPKVEVQFHVLKYIIMLWHSAFLMASQRKECISANYSMVEIKHYYELSYNLHMLNIVILYYIQLFLFPLFESLCQQTV